MYNCLFIKPACGVSCLVVLVMFSQNTLMKCGNLFVLHKVCVFSSPYKSNKIVILLFPPLSDCCDLLGLNRLTNDFGRTSPEAYVKCGIFNEMYVNHGILMKCTSME